MLQQSVEHEVLLTGWRVAEVTAGVVEGGYRVRIVSTKCKAITVAKDKGSQLRACSQATNSAKVVS